MEIVNAARGALAGDLHAQVQAFAAAAVAALALTAGSARAEILVFDNFESYGATSKTNFTGFANLTVTDGTVDYIHEPDFRLSTPYGTGLVDLDGSTNNGGFLRSASFSFNAGDKITFDFDLSGKQRGSGEETVMYGYRFGAGTMLSTIFSQRPGGPFISGSLLAPTLGATSNTFPSSATPWGHYLIGFTMASAGSVSFFIGTDSNDSQGALVDNFRVYRGSLTAPAPEPATWGLMIAGFGLAGAALRRRRAVA